MKSKFNKLISCLLILACLVSFFTVFSFAAEEGEGGEAEASTLQVLFNRDFEDGWDIDNGTSITNEQNHKFTIGREELADYSYNHFIDLESVNDLSGFFALNYGAYQPAKGGSILEFDVNIDDYNNMGNIMYIRTPGGATTGTLCSVLYIENNKLKVFDYEIGLMNQGWMHVALNMNFDQNEFVCHSCNSLFVKEGFEPRPYDGVYCENCGHDILYHRIKFRVFFSLSETFDPDNALDGSGLSGKLTSADFQNTYYFDYIMKVGSDQKPDTWKQASLDFFRFGPGLGNRSGVAGQSVQFDNIKLYSDAEQEVGTFMEFEDLSDAGYGKLVNTNRVPTIDVGKGGSINDIIKKGVIFKTNSNYLLNDDTKKAIYTDSETGYAYGAPKKIDGQVYIPFEPILNMTGYPYFWHDDNRSCDISTAAGTSILTIGRDTATVNGQAVKLTAAPTYLKSEKTDDMYPVIALEDVEIFFQGLHVTYDTMGLIGICEAEHIFDRYTDLNAMLTYMKKFVFDYLTGEEFYDKVKEHTNNFDHPYIMADQETFDYIYDVYSGKVQDETYKSWIDRWVRTSEGYYNTYTSQPTGPHVAVTTEWDFNEKDPDYELLYFEMTNALECGIWQGKWEKQKYDYGQYPHYNSEDYSYGVSKENPADASYVGEHYNDGAEIETGRAGYIQSAVQHIQYVAFGYVLTRDLKYAQLAWEMCESFMKWRHWGQHHFLCVAEVGHNLAQVYDWLYDVWTEEFNYDTNKLAQAMYEKIIWFGYVVTEGKDTTAWFEDYSIQPGTTPYNDMTINWNAVCTSGMTMTELAIIGAEDKEGNDFKVGTDYRDKPYTTIDFTTTRCHFDNVDKLNILYYTMASNFESLCMLGLNQYPPDGSYIESPGYWSFATDNLAEMVWSLETALGDDLGIFDFAGMDTTWYYAVQSEFPSDTLKKNGYCYWNYHDSFNGEQSSFNFFFVSEALGDPALAAIRMQHISNGKIPEQQDILGYKPEYKELASMEIELDRDFLLENLDGVLTRSSWDQGALFTGIMGDANNITAHGQVDCGNWIYSNQNYTWFVDMGADEYDLYEYFNGAYRYSYYRATAEGANVLITTSHPETIAHGQQRGGKAPFQYNYYESNEYGMKAVLEGTTLFDPYCNLYYRGMLLTNDRSTVVIQDQAAFNTSSDLVWIAHTKCKDITISDDGRTALLKEQVLNGQYRTLRVSIVEEKATDVTFEIIDAGIDTFLLDNTHRWDYSESKGGEPEYSREGFRRLNNRDEGVKNFNLAVVIELLDEDELTTSAVKYDYQDMRDWTPVKEYTGYGSGSGGAGGEGADETIDTLTPKDIIKYANDCKKFVDLNFAFTSRTVDFFKCLARVNNGFNSLNIDRYKGVEAMETAYANYLDYMAKYKAFREDVNAKLYMDTVLTRSFTGV